ECGQSGEAKNPAQAPGADCDGAARRAGKIFSGRAGADAVDVDTDTAFVQDASRNHDWHAGEQAAADYAGSRRRIWLKAQRVCGRSADGMDFHAAQPSGEMD